MRYYIDTEFDGFGGDLISLALVREDGESIYLIYKDEADNPWVRDNVIPILLDVPAPLPGMIYKVDQLNGAILIAAFLEGDDDPEIVADWPDDIAYFCKAVITAPGRMVNINRCRFRLERVDAYPTELPGAVQHNAWHDARALWWLMETKK